MYFVKLSEVSTIKQGDTKRSFSANIFDADNNAVNLTNTTVTLFLANKSAVVLQKQATITSATGGVVSFGFDNEDLTGYGFLDAEFRIAFADGTKATAPTSGYVKIKINQQLTDRGSTTITPSLYSQVIEAQDTQDAKITEQAGKIDVLSKRSLTVSISEFESYAVKENGVIVDWKPAFDAADNYLKSTDNTKVYEGGNISIPGGTYYLKTTYTPSDKVNLIGEGRGISVLKIPNNMNETVTLAYDIVSTKTGASNFITKITFDGNRFGNSWPIVGNANYGLAIKSKNAIIDDCEFVNVTGNGSGVPVSSENVVFRNCYSHENGKKGFHSGLVKRISFIGNYAYNNEIDSGIGLHQGAYESIVYGNHCFNNGTYGIHLGDSTYAISSNSRRTVINANQCNDNAVSGIYINASDVSNPNMLIESVISSNICLRNGTGIHISTAKGFVLSSNVTSDNNSQGIKIFSCDDGLVKENIVLNNSKNTQTDKCGILVTGGSNSSSSKITSSNINVSDNILKDTQTTATQTIGIILGSNSSLCNVSKNIINGGSYAIRNYAGVTANHSIYDNATALTVDDNIIRNVDMYQVKNQKNLDGSNVPNNTMYRYGNDLYWKDNAGVVKKVSLV